MREDAGFLLSAMVAICFLGGFGGYVISESQWKTDCQKISAHVTFSGQVYKCEQQK